MAGSQDVASSTARAQALGVAAVSTWTSGMPVHLAAAASRSTASRLAADQCAVVSRRQLLAAGIPRWLVRLELRTGRWQPTGQQTVALHNGPLDVASRRWVAVLEAGPRAALDGVSALQAAGVEHLTDDALTVVVPKGARRRRLAGVRIRETRRYRAEDVVRSGIPRTTPAVAAVHAALWAATDKQATYFLTLAVQQGLCRPAELSDAATAVRRHPRRRVLAQVVLDLADGSRSLGELDVARAMRSRGLPEPVRQAVRRRPSGTQYLDADFPTYGVSMEVDGSQHDLPHQRLADLVRDLGLATEGRTTVRIPLVAWRLDEAAVLDGLEQLFRSRGWQRPAA
jgi:very-short-patch-repair endonuclease